MESDSISIKIKRTSNYFSPLRYPGGKSCLSYFLNNLLTQNSIDGIYIEPYAGGAGAALELLFHEKVEKIVINDYDRSIYAIWYSILNHHEEFISRIESALLTINEWNNIKQANRSSNLCLKELGFRSFYLNRTNRSGIIEGGPIGGMNQQGKWKLDARFNKKGLIERIEKIHMYKNRIVIHNLDGIQLMDRYSKLHNKLVYIDPPYYNKGSSLYYSHYKDADHKKLAKFLNRNYKQNWVLTYDNTDQIRNLYPDRKQQTFSINYHASKPKIGSEVMIFSDSINLSGAIFS